MAKDPLPTPKNFDKWKPKRQRRYIRKNAGPGNTQSPPPAASTEPQPTANFPEYQQPKADFLPMTPQFEAGRRGLDDEYSGAMMGLINQRDLIRPQLDLGLARMGTDQKYSNAGLDEALVERGMFDSGSNAYLRNRDIDIPYGRQRQDMGMGASQAYSDIASQMSQAGLGYSQGMHELMLNRAADSAADMPMNVPQYGPKGPRKEKPYTSPAEERDKRERPRRRNRRK